ncbi:MAG: hypothetical protein OEW11_08175 [Nitrospirota bacterium]|nr:hypothetical protein [Nitrospirota bacterium]
MRITRSISVLFPVLSLLALPLVATAQQFVTENGPPPTYATVTGDNTVVFATAASNGEVLTKLRKGDMVPVKKVADGWATLAWSAKAYVAVGSLRLPEGSITTKPSYEDMREAFIKAARAADSTLLHVEVPRQTGILVRFHWKEYRDREALIQRAEALARTYSLMTTGESGIEVNIVNGNDSWAKAFY